MKSTSDVAAKLSTRRKELLSLVQTPLYNNKIVKIVPTHRCNDKNNISIYFDFGSVCPN